MWSRRDAAKILALAAVFTAVALLLFPAAARPATGHDAQLVAWYLKGEGDAFFAGRGWTIGKLTCAPAAGVYVNCRMRIDNRASSSLCSHGRFRLDHFAVTGQFSKARICSPTA